MSEQEINFILACLISFALFCVGLFYALAFKKLIDEYYEPQLVWHLAAGRIIYVMALASFLFFLYKLLEI